MTTPAESPNPARVAAAKAYHERKKREKSAAEEGEVWYELVEKKVVKKIKKPSGRVYSVYYCTRAEADAKGLTYKK